MIWPTTPNGDKFVGKIKLNHTSVLDYLDASEALPLRHTVADIIKQHECKTVVDVGCGVGRMYDFIEVEHYMGFDDDQRLVRRGWRKNKGDAKFDLRVSSWNDLNKLDVDYEVDCLLFLGVLSYAMPAYPEVFEKNGWHYQMFHNMIDKFKPKRIIIQEILEKQTHVASTNELKVLPLDYYMDFNPTYYELDLPIWCGHRAILDIDTNNVRKANSPSSTA